MTLFQASPAPAGTAPAAQDPFVVVFDAVGARHVSHDAPGRAPVAAAPAQAVLRPLCVADGAALHALVQASPPLDCNSVYAYLLLAQHHGATCVVAEGGDGLLGAVTAYIPPDQPDTLFVWQVAVAREARGQGLGARMLDYLRQHLMPARGLRWLETTITPGNAPSHRLFTSFGLRHDIGCAMTPLFTAAQFGEHGHDDELLYRIGPWPARA